MTYSELLSNYIKNSGLTLRKISSNCEQLGVSVDPSYISKLQTGKMPPPSEDISRALAQVCNGDVNKLITLGYIGKAPTQVQKSLDEYIKRWDYLISIVYEDMKEQNATTLTEEEFKKNLNNLPIEEQFDFIFNTFQRISYLILNNNNTSEYALNETGKKFLSDETNKPILRIPVYKLIHGSDKLEEVGYKWVSSHDISHFTYDYFYLIFSLDYPSNGLFPSNSSLLIEKISKDDKQIWGNLQNGNLVLVSYNNKDFFARYYLEGDIVILQRDSQNSAPIIIKPADSNKLDILGKVIKIEFNPNESSLSTENN